MIDTNKLHRIAVSSLKQTGNSKAYYAVLYVSEFNGTMPLAWASCIIVLFCGSVVGILDEYDNDDLRLVLSHYVQICSDYDLNNGFNNCRY